MPRRNKNARFKPKHREFKESEAIIVEIEQRRDDISPGRLVAAAEWKDNKKAQA